MMTDVECPEFGWCTPNTNETHESHARNSRARPANNFMHAPIQSGVTVALDTMISAQIDRYGHVDMVGWQEFTFEVSLQLRLPTCLKIGSAMQPDVRPVGRTPQILGVDIELRARWNHTSLGLFFCIQVSHVLACGLLECSVCHSSVTRHRDLADRTSECVRVNHKDLLHLTVVVQFRTVVMELHDGVNSKLTLTDVSHHRRFAPPTFHMTDRAKFVTLFFTR
jgi:hypothetical protein